VKRAPAYIEWMGVRLTSEELAATGIYLALCVDAKTGLVRSNTGTKRWRPGIPTYWRVDIYKVLETLAKHGIISKYDVADDNVFYLVRNGYVKLRKLRIPSLETLVTSIAKSKTLIEAFCRDFPREAKRYIVAVPGTKNRNVQERRV